MGASGGPKWFVLGQLDRFLFGDFLQRSSHPLATLGSSIGSWRNACLALDDPAAAIDRMEQGYLYQTYDNDRPTPREISAVSQDVLESMLEFITDELSDGKPVRLVGFGLFEVRDRKGRVGRNPRTGEKIEISQTKTPAFIAGKALKDAVKK